MTELDILSSLGLDTNFALQKRKRVCVAILLSKQNDQVQLKLYMFPGPRRKKGRLNGILLHSIYTTYRLLL